MCEGKDLDDPEEKRVHRQLSSNFIAYKISNSIKTLATMMINHVIDTVKSHFGYEMKYGKAWKAKHAAFKMLYGDCEEAYNRLLRLLGAMAATNPEMYHVVEPFGQKTREYKGATVRVFGRTFLAFQQSVKAFQHFRPVISVDGPLLTGKFNGALLVVIGNWE
jgi:hypothetical protein